MTLTGGHDADPEDGNANPDVAMENLKVVVNEDRVADHPVDFTAGAPHIESDYLYGAMHPLDWAFGL